MLPHLCVSLVHHKWSPSKALPLYTFYLLLSEHTMNQLFHHSLPQIMIASRLSGIPRLLRQVPGVLREVPIGKLLLAALPFLTYLFVFRFYNQLRAFTHLQEISPPNYIVLSNIEYHLFFCHPHQILAQFTNPLFDFLAAIPYLLHFGLPFLFAAYLAINPRRRPALYPYMWCAGWVNLLAVTIHLTFPTAPPWFTDHTVLDQHGNIVFEVPNESAFRRLDKLLGFTLFHSVYARSPVKFGAFPSLHSAWPMVILLNNPWFGKRVAVVHVIWIGLAALYSGHHYLLDVLGGISLAIIVKVCMLKIWSPFPELSEVQQREAEAVERTATLRRPFEEIV